MDTEGDEEGEWDGGMEMAFGLSTSEGRSYEEPPRKETAVAEPRCHK